MKDLDKPFKDIKPTRKDYKHLFNTFHWIYTAPDGMLIDLIKAASDEMSKRSDIRSREKTILVNP